VVFQFGTFLQTREIKMAEPTRKAPEIDELLTSITGRSRVTSIQDNVCTTCGRPALEFNDSLSKKEYTIFGMCQRCQDSVFGKGDEE